MTSDPSTTRVGDHPRLLTWSSGGLVIAGSIVLTLAILVWQLILVLPRYGSRAQGDGKDPATYGFDLSGLTVPRDTLAASGLARNQMRVLVDPPTVDIAWVETFNAARGANFLVSTDLVIGVVVAGIAHAYPLRVIAWHEIINDTIGGQPVAITYSPWAGSIAIYDRRHGAETLEFGFSGLLYQSHQVFFDRRPEGGESLWSQLEGRAISGPMAAADARLERLPFVVAPWAEWCAMQPETRIIDPTAPGTRPYLKKWYPSNPYGSYVANDKEVRFGESTHPLPPSTGMPWKTWLLVVTLGDSERAYSPQWVESHAGSDGIARDRLGAVELSLTRADSEPPCVRLLDLPPGVTTRQVFWFAWHAAHPDEPALAPE